MRLFPLRSSSSSSLEMGKDGRENSEAMVYLNIYDLTPLNNYFYVFGLGIYHSGIEVHGMEYAFGAHEYPTSGVFEVEPRSCPGFIFRRSLLLGTTDLSHSEFHAFMERLSEKYHGDTYHLIANNCNHFTDDVCQQLIGKPIPSWVNRLARVGSYCSCLLPESLQVAAVSHLPEHLSYSDDDGSESLGLSLSGDSEGEDPDHHLLSPSSGDLAFVKEIPVRLARDLL